MALYSKRREISDNELDQIVGGVGTFSGSVMKYQVETELDRLSRSNPAAYAQLSAAHDRLLAEGGRRVFGRTDDPNVQDFMKKLKSAMG